MSLPPAYPMPPRHKGKLAINLLRERDQLTGEAVDQFLSEHTVPIVEGSRCTFLYRGDVDAVAVRHRIVNQPQHVPMKRLDVVDGATLWYVTIELPAQSRVEYQVEVRVGAAIETFNDPLNPHVAHSPMGSSSVLQAAGYETPSWVLPQEDARPGELVDLQFHSKALRRTTHSQVYLPARFRRSSQYPLLVVHDGAEYITYAAMKTVLDNLIHNLDMAETIVVFSNPGDRLKEYPNHASHSRHVATELVPAVESRLPVIPRADSRCLMGASFGAVAALSTAHRNPEMFGNLFLQSGSFVFTDIGSDHGGGPAFDPVVKFVNRYRAKPRKLADRMFITCGVYEPLIVPNRSMVPVFESTGAQVRYVESRDGHSWENWRDRLRDGLSWIFPGPQKFVYE
ncbi:alpha/beta hydrolase [Ornithinimicrobium cerasi]|uniref:Enterochelin esterase n=1 Tax=Ornithinimicrobium cerasi TaxID=2248773 RepID=A0A285VWL6_9MICO|nr:alpha/beta hydrolase-fold protein [Ornithinimicrobium cerasi]SOC58434.1 enterochelin esterase [Ornithinimicrobium cerasi]